MIIKVYDGRAYEGESDVNVWCEDVPSDFADDDVRYTIECLAAKGDQVAKLALELVRHWCESSRERRSKGVRIYRDGVM